MALSSKWIRFWIVTWLVAAGACVAGQTPDGRFETNAIPGKADTIGAPTDFGTRMDSTLPASGRAAYTIDVQAGAYVSVQGDYGEGTSRTARMTIALYGPIAEDVDLEDLDLDPIAEERFRSPTLWTELEEAGTYLVTVEGLAERDYFLAVGCENAICTPNPVSLSERAVGAAIERLAEAVECEGCSAEAFGFEYAETAEAPSRGQWIEPTQLKIRRDGQDYGWHELLTASALEEWLEGYGVGGLTDAARAFAGVDEDAAVEAVAMDGMVQIPLEDATDGWGTNTLFLHFEETRKVLVLHIDE